jgi:hypothetical protein
MVLREDITHRAEVLIEEQKIKHLKILVDLTCYVLSYESLTKNEAIELIKNVKKAAIDLFPGKGKVFDLIYLPRFGRILSERGIIKNQEIRLDF